MSEELDIRWQSAAEAAGLLGWPADTVRAHIAPGLPLRKDGRVDLVVYAAWLNTEEARVDSASS